MAAEVEPVPLCSVCIANYNGESMLAECIDSILAQRGGHALEIIVHDDASQDGSLSLLRDRYPHVTVIASDTNVGFCIANNRMVQRARAPFVLLLNNDAALFDDAIEQLLQLSGSLAAPAILTLPQYNWTSGALVDRGCLLDAFMNPVPNLSTDRQDVAMAIGACLFLPRELWIALGGFPEWIGSIGEDLLLCGQARLRSVPVAVTRGSGFRHRQGSSFGGNALQQAAIQTTFRRRRLSERNKTAALYLLTPAPWMLPLLAMHLSLLLIEGLVLALIRRQFRLLRDIYLPAIAFVPRNLAWLSKARATEQQQRRASVQHYFSTTTWMPRKISMLFAHGLPRVAD